MNNLESKEEKSTVVVGMSGGVDSSVAALLLKQQGYKVIGLFMKNWDETDERGDCPSEREYRDVISVCEKLEIPYYSIEFVEEYRQQVFEHFLESHKKGETPNPDILCNREIKFNVFYKKALSLGADYLATGHYCQIEKRNGRSSLIKGVDHSKDQTYFLYTNKSEILDKVLFPIGHLKKVEVRQLAIESGLSVAKKKDSTGICFIGERNFRDFLSQFIAFRRGKFVSLKGEIVGEHVGAAFYTIGQRKGLGLGGPGEPWFVLKKSMEKNEVTVERGERHPALYSDACFLRELSWVDESKCLVFPFSCHAKVRYRQDDQECTVVGFSGDARLEVRFKAPQRAMAMGQAVVFYNKEVCLGGGFIDRIEDSYYERKISL